MGEARCTLRKPGHCDMPWQKGDSTTINLSQLESPELLHHHWERAEAIETTHTCSDAKRKGVLARRLWGQK